MAAALLRPHPLVSGRAPTSCSSCGPSRKPGRLTLDIEDGTFSRAQHRAFLAEHADDITRFRDVREAAFRTERDAWEQSGELARAEASQAFLPRPTPTRSSLPDGAVVVESSLHACVWRVHVEEGQVVGPGEVVVTVEAMKMETAIAAPVGGVVSRDRLRARPDRDARLAPRRAGRRWVSGRTP